jgi:hypothetical protein
MVFVAVGTMLLSGGTRWNEQSLVHDRRDNNGVGIEFTIIELLFRKDLNFKSTD